ncbi:MAG: rhomboid family intramembrane serine protease [Flavobacteriaceae bacterium]|nr:rhomboid family intramembrane serine protease [Flavobacteriaceae bacterium]
MTNLIDQLKYHYQKATVVEKLIYINVAVFFIGYLFNTLAFLMTSQTNFVFDWFALPAEFDQIIYRPWSIISYAFLHDGLWHILSNLLILYYIGNLFLEYFTQKEFINYYFLGAIFGGFIYIMSYNYFPVFKNSNGILVGASASVTAIFIGITTYIPHYEIKIRFIGFVKLWLLAVIWIGMDVIQIPVDNAGGHLAHLGGALIGFILTYLFKNNGNFLESLNKIFTVKKQKPLRTVYKSKAKTKSAANTQISQKRIDEILDKISKSGYETLSKEEKDFLFKSGKS